MSAAAATESKGAKRRPYPVYHVEIVEGDLPENARPRRRHKDPLTDPLRQVINDGTLHGRPVCVGTYYTRNGAKSAMLSIQKKERSIPHGEWEFEYRYLEDPDADGEYISKLYATYMGPPAD